MSARIEQGERQAARKEQLHRDVAHNAMACCVARDRHNRAHEIEESTLSMPR